MGAGVESSQPDSTEVMLAAKRSNIDRLARSSIVVLACVFASFAVLAGVARADEKTMVSQEEVESHRIGRRPIIRVSWIARIAAELGMSGIGVQVVVNPDGVVTSAKATSEDVSENLRMQAEAAVRQLRYRPFERGGHAVWATFEESVGVLPPEIKPWWHTAFPAVRDWNSVLITLSRTVCLGTCPSYRVEVHGDGTVLYEGGAYVAILGKHRCAIPVEQVRELVSLFQGADYYSLRTKYYWPVTDNPTYITSVAIDGEAKMVSDYVGLMSGMPMAVSDLEDSIDRLSGSERWTKGNADTVRSLKDENWDFKSFEAARALAVIAQHGSLQAVREFVAEGTPMNGSDGMGGTPLTWATVRGDLPMLRILLDAGALKQSARTVGGATPATLLTAAASSGVPSVVEEILKMHPDVNARSKDGGTALMAAVGQYHDGPENPDVNRAKVVQILLRAGADPNARDEHGTTALIEASRDPDAALALIHGGADINARDDYGITPLINCVSPGVARILLENGADASIRDKEGKTALDHARQSKWKEMEAVLLQNRR